MTPRRQDDDPRFTPILLRRHLIANGYTDRSIKALVKQGTWVKLRHGAYASSKAWAALDDGGRHELITRAVVTQARTPSVPSHSSAVTLHGGPTYGLDLTSVDITRTDGKAGRAEAGVRQHCGKILDGDIQRLHDLDVMSPTRVALEVTTQADIPASLCVMNDFLHRRLTTQDNLVARYELGIDTWSKTLTTPVVLRLAHPRITNVAESLAWHLMWTQSIPRPEPQFEIRDEDGEVGATLDFAWPEHKSFLEVDGRSKYTQYLREGETALDPILREKQRTEWVQEVTGWRIIRVTWADLFRPERTGARIRRVLSGQVAA